MSKKFCPADIKAITDERLAKIGSLEPFPWVRMKLNQIDWTKAT